MVRKEDIHSIYGEFLTGKKVDVGKRFYDLSMPGIVDRIEFLRQRCVGKKVLHLGCLDHPEIIEQRVREGTWLHGIVSDAAELCLGIDVNVCALELVQRKLNIRNVRLLDLSGSLEEKHLSEIRKVKWDLILCPEMLEHFTNHQQFLQNVRSLSSSEAATLVVTVPNAFQFANFINALRGFESINSDHKYWFTFYTLSRLLAANGWEPHRLVYYNEPTRRNWLVILSRLATQLSRVFASGLIIEATHSN